MPDMSSLRSLYSDSIDVIRNYLSAELGPVNIRVGEDFDRDGVVLRAEKGSARTFRVFLSHEFLSDFQTEEIAAKLSAWRVADGAKTLPSGHTLFVATEGVFSELTEGPSLRESTQRFAKVLPSSPEMKELYDRAFSVPVNGVPLGDIPSEMQGDPDLYISYSDDFANKLGAVYLLDAAGYRGFELRAVPTTPVYLGVDFEVKLASGDSAFLDFQRAADQVERRANAMREQINVGLRRAMRENKDLRRSIEGTYIDITCPRSPTSKSEVDATVAEITHFVISNEWTNYGNSSIVPFDEDRYPRLSSLGARVYVSQGTTYLSVQEGARTFDPGEPYHLASRLVKNEARRRFDIQPVWLGIYLSEMALVFPVPLEEFMKSVRVEETPFEEILVGSAGRAAVTGNKDSKMAMMNFREWSKKIATAVRNKRDVDIKSSEEVVTFLCGERGVMLRALSGHTAALVPALVLGGTIEEGDQLQGRSQWMESRNFSIDNLSLPHVVRMILALLAPDY
jgi:hypothetical protein